MSVRMVLSGRRIAQAIGVFFMPIDYCLIIKIRIVTLTESVTCTSKIQADYDRSLAVLTKFTRQIFMSKLNLKVTTATNELSFRVE